MENFMFFGLSPFNVKHALASLKTDTLYNASVVLYASALLKDKSHYLEALSAMEIKFKETPNNSFKAWMLGRVALAATHMGDQETVVKTVPALKDLLEQKEVAEDESRAWALGYLAAVNLAEYKT
ncbi:MAG: hypothetical protein KF775_19705, partial [Cyclobacteriaceae bacterium]|nr:hypothetical protein [Cyclobacteriaceae bacterium]